VSADVAPCRLDASTEPLSGACVRVSNFPIGCPEERARSFGILSSFPPTACGLATFTAALTAGLVANDTQAGVVRVVDTDGQTSPTDPVIGELVNGSPRSLLATADTLNECDVAVVQHEYGLYGGTDGDEVLEILGNLHVPSIAIAHTILANPTPHQRSVLNEVAALASAVVVMTEAARIRLCQGFDVDPSKVTTIAHGAAVPRARAVPDRARRPVILTWGLIGPGKGIERVIEAMRTLHDLPTKPRYLVAGQTHPKVLAAHGESYRQDRMDQAERHGISSSVVFDADYRDVASLTTLIQSSQVVVLPYDSKDQVTSGVLVDAIAAGRPVVATAFPHAMELLSSGAGLVVDHDDPDAMARALREVLTKPETAERMAREARRLAPGLGWSMIAGEYVHLANRLLVEQMSLV
jgi:glycosyltransferase involved in cell wall biosynthesis